MKGVPSNKIAAPVAGHAGLGQSRACPRGAPRLREDKGWTRGAARHRHTGLWGGAGPGSWLVRVRDREQAGRTVLHGAPDSARS